MLRVATEEFGETTAQLVEPTGYFVDFMRYAQQNVVQEVKSPWIPH